jgi:hypothetical protein
MDAEHAFSTCLTLVIVYIAFPFSERDIAAMETALAVLRGMGEKGNEYLQARYALLMKLRSTFGLGEHTGLSMSMPASGFGSGGGIQHNQSFNPHLNSVPSSAIPITQMESTFQPYQDISFNFDVEDDPKLWEEISGNIDIDMDTSWIRSTLREEAYQGPPM